MGNGGQEAGNCIVAVEREPASSVDQFTVHCTNTAVPSFGGARIEASRHRATAASACACRTRSGRWMSAPWPIRSFTPPVKVACGSVSAHRASARRSHAGAHYSREPPNGRPDDFVVDVPEDANVLQAGYWMQGKGQLWIRDLKVEEVPNTVPVNLVVSVPRADSGPRYVAGHPVVPGANDRFIPPPPRWLALGDQGFELCDAGMDVKLLAAGQRNLAISCSFPIRAFIRHAFESPSYWGKRVRSRAISRRRTSSRARAMAAGRQWPAWRRAVHGRHGHRGSCLPRHRDGHDGLDLPGTGHRHSFGRGLHPRRPVTGGHRQGVGATSSSRKCRAIHRSPRWPCPVVESREYQQVAGYTGRPARATPLNSSGIGQVAASPHRPSACIQRISPRARAAASSSG